MSSHSELRVTKLQGLAIMDSSLILLKGATIARKFSDEFFYFIRHDRGRVFVDEL